MNVNLSKINPRKKVKFWYFLSPSFALINAEELTSMELTPLIAPSLVPSLIKSKGRSRCWFVSEKPYKEESFMGEHRSEKLITTMLPSEITYLPNKYLLQ